MKNWNSLTKVNCVNIAILSRYFCFFMYYFVYIFLLFTSYYTGNHETAMCSNCDRFIITCPLVHFVAIICIVLYANSIFNMQRIII